MGTWNIWKHRNKCIFQGAVFDTAAIINDSVLHSWSWLKGLERDFCYSFQQWSFNLRACIISDLSVNRWICCNLWVLIAEYVAFSVYRFSDVICYSKALLVPFYWYICFWRLKQTTTTSDQHFYKLWNLNMLWALRFNVASSILKVNIITFLRKTLNPVGSWCNNRCQESWSMFVRCHNSSKGLKVSWNWENIWKNQTRSLGLWEDERTKPNYSPSIICDI